MKHFSFIILIAIILTSFTSDKPIVDCKCEGIPLHGRVKVLEYNADFEVRVVRVHADLEVKKVTSLPLKCGEWQFVESSPDFTVRFVNANPDFTIRYVDVHPGTP